MQHLNNLSKSRIVLPSVASSLDQQQKATVTRAFAEAFNAWITTVNNFLGLFRN